MPEVVEAIDAPPPKPKLGGIFKDTDPSKLAALEAAARKEMERARRQGVTIDLFGGKKK